MSWNRPKEDGRAVSTKPPLRRGHRPRPTVAVIAGVIVVLGAGIAAWWIFGNGPAPVAEDGDGTVGRRIKEVKPAVTNAAPVAVAEVPVEEDPAKRIVAELSFKTNAGLGMVTRVYKTADGKTHKVYKPAYKPLFKHGTDQVLAMVLGGTTGHIPPLMIRGGAAMDEQFRRSLKDPIVINATDSERVKARKQQVIEARETIRELMDRGAHFSDILEDHRRIFNENVDIRAAAMRELNAIHEQGDAEGERAYRFKMDIALGQMGIDPLDDPKTKAERRQEHEARRAAIELEKANRKKGTNGK